MNGHQQAQARSRLEVLKEHLTTCGSDLKFAGTGLLVTTPSNQTGRRRSVLVMCHPRPDDAGKLWFWLHGPTPHPIAPADRIIDAAVEICGALRSTGATDGYVIDGTAGTYIITDSGIVPLDVATRMLRRQI
ncbi:hypothetical protein D0T12_13630 [Actinomadura spongiicola]|uniref:Uncharacterized protein n=1 Tax=Actinomadura spongiicola TaxID=2303421 RepID=A0A372GHJ4_9ACTN|nr:hypothetical protein [Actinomadura spongiicola]RFS84589.1 hypothetical protein D0T12_13630 [Actinomadura spongiicola]